VLDYLGLASSFQLIGRPLQETELLRAADCYQQATEWHRREPDMVAGTAWNTTLRPLKNALFQAVYSADARWYGPPRRGRGWPFYRVISTI
jgi:hypothetical protein